MRTARSGRFFFFLLKVLLALNKASGRRHHIYGGQDVEMGEHAFAVAILQNHDSTLPRLKCAGSLISPVHILTAAHCTKDFDDKDVTKLLSVAVGATDLDDIDTNGGEFGILDTRVHKESNVDLAILKLNDPSGKIPNMMRMCFVERTRLPQNTSEAPLKSGDAITAFGWGTTENGKHSDRMRQVQLTYLPRDECKKKWEEKGGKGVPLSNFCALANQGKDTCRGDSGGPIMRRTGKTVYQVGVTRKGDVKCGASDARPGKYTDLAKQIEWIKEAVSQLGGWTEFEEIDC